MSTEILRIYSNVINVFSPFVHSVFDPLYLTGVSRYWHIMLVSLACHCLILKATPVVSKMLFPNAYGKLDDEGKRGWTVSVLTLVHSVFDSSFAIAYLNHPTLNNDKMEGYDRDFEIYLAIAGGYYLWDFLVCTANFSSYGLMYLVHAGIGLHGVFVLSSRHLQFYALPFLLPEVSSIFLHIRHLLKYAGKTNTLLYKINFLAFVITFIGIRFGFEAYHTLLLASNVYRGKTGNTFFPFAVFVTVMGLALTTLNAIWLRQILTATYYTLFKSAEKDSVKGKKAKSE